MSFNNLIKDSHNIHVRDLYNEYLHITTDGEDAVLKTNASQQLIFRNQQVFPIPPQPLTNAFFRVETFMTAPITSSATETIFNAGVFTFSQPFNISLTVGDIVSATIVGIRLASGTIINRSSTIIPVISGSNVSNTAGTYVKFGTLPPCYGVGYSFHKTCINNGTYNTFQIAYGSPIFFTVGDSGNGGTIINTSINDSGAWDFETKLAFIKGSSGMFGSEFINAVFAITLMVRVEKGGTAV